MNGFGELLCGWAVTVKVTWTRSRFMSQYQTEPSFVRPWLRKVWKKNNGWCRLQKSPCLTSCSPVVNCVKQASITRLQTTLYLTDFYTLTTGSKHGENVICDGLIMPNFCLLLLYMMVHNYMTHYWLLLYHSVLSVTLEKKE